ncbi:hypothetical protein BGX26_006527 [Mortierella sp. AD094]|nr:hypothetical protein BGX26_006527 [Mortierella sp. AD094]
MSTDNTTILAPNGCPVEDLPEDPAHLFSKNGITLDLPRIGWIGSGVCMVVATIISFVLIYRHYQYYTKPNQQRYIVRMLLMVPIYAITSWFSFVYVREAIYYDTIRVLYEAFVIASFFILMLQYLGDSLEDQKRILKRHKKTERWFFPMCCLKYNPSRPHFLQYMKWGILQYVPLNILVTVLTIVLQIQGSYCEGSWNPKFGHVWVMVINFCSVSAATYFLIMFYLTIHKDLKDYDPFYKFLAVKLVVFFSFWQSVVIEGLVYFGLIKATTYWSTGDISTGVNAVLIDIEMVFFSLIHLKAFSYKPYVPLIPNPDFQQQQQQELLSDVDTRNNDNENFKNIYSPNNRNNKYPSMDSMRSNRPPGSRPQMSVSQQPNAKKKPTPNADSKSGTKEKGTKKPDGPPEKIMDFTQKTPIWKGILDSFNPLDTIRELGYGIQYLYRWIRGIPVDKDSRRLLDLERAFGRQRPEVPYIPSKDEEDEDEKKKKKKKKGQESDTDNDIDTGGDDDDDDDEKDGSPNKYENRDDLEMGYVPGKNAASGRYHRFPNEDPAVDRGTRGAPPQRRAGAAYDMMFDSPGGTIRLAGGVGSGIEGGQSRVARKPVRPITNNNVTNGSLSTAAGRRIAPGRGQQHLRKKDSAEYLGKEEAAHTERATLPDIQPEPVERKIALSGLYVDQPLSPVDIPDSPRSSPDIPVPMNYQRQPYHTEYQRTREWERELDREQLRGATNQQPSRFEHRDPELVRAAVPYLLPDPVVPTATRPEAASGSAVPPATATAASSSFKNAIPQGTGSGFAQYGNRNFESSEPYQSDRRFERDNFRVDASGIPLEAKHLRDNSAARYRRDLDYDYDYDYDYSRRPVHTKDESGDTSFLSTSDSMGIGMGQQQFYHHREASRSDPELAHRRVDQRELYQDQKLYPDNQDHDQRYDGRDHSPERSQAYQNPPQQQEQSEPSSSQPKPQQSEDLPEPKDDIDPIVAQYNQLQYRQKLQEQKRQQQEIEEQRQQQEQQQRQQQERQQQEQQRQQEQEQEQRAPRPPFLRRRNSLESLDSDSSGGMFRTRAMAAAYDRNYGYGPNSSSRPKEGRYQRAYRYPMPAPQSVPPIQVYRFPEDREIYEQRKREQQLLKQRYDQQPPYGPSVRVPPIAQQRDRERDQRFYQPQPYQQYSRPYYDNDGYAQYTQRYDQPCSGYERSSDTRYRSPPTQPMDPRSRSMYPSQPGRRATMDYPDERGRGRELAGPNVSGGGDVLFPASRYAAPFVRDYELQQREGRRRLTKSPPAHQSSVAGGPRFVEDGPYDEAVVWRRPAGPTGTSSRERP